MNLIYQDIAFDKLIWSNKWLSHSIYDEIKEPPDPGDSKV